MSKVTSFLQDALHASLEGSNLPVPRSVDLESEIEEIETEIDSLYEERQEIQDTVSTTAALESYLGILEKQLKEGSVSQSTMQVVQLGIESLLGPQGDQWSFESLGLESDSPDVGKFKQFVDKLKAFIKSRLEEISIKVRLMKQKIMPSVKGTSKIVADIQRVLDRMDPSLSLPEGLDFGSSDLDYEKLDVGSGRIEDASEVIQRFHSAMVELEDNWYPEFRAVYGGVVDSWKKMELDSIENYRQSFSHFLDKHPPLLEMTKKTQLIEAFDQTGLVLQTVDPQVSRLRNSWVSDNNPIERRLVQFINDGDAHFSIKSFQSALRYQRVPALGRTEMQAILSTMADDLKYLIERERSLGRQWDPAFDDDPESRLGLFSNLTNGQRQLFNEFSLTVFYTVTVPWDHQTDLLMRMIRVYAAVIRWIQISIKAHKSI